MNCLRVGPGFPKYGWYGLLCLAAALAGCGRNDAQVYRVAKDPQAAASETPPTPLPAGHPDISAGQPKLQYKVPADWQEMPAGQIRVASFRVSGANGQKADVSVVPLPGQAGSDIDNVNRWRGQLGLPPVPADDLPKLAQTVEAAHQEAPLYDLAGPTNRILAAVVRRGGVAWFFKMTGDDSLVAQQKPAFVEFLKSLNLAIPTQSTDLPPSHPPIGGDAMTPPMAGAPMAPASTPTPASDRPTWQVPAGWQEVAAGQFLTAKFIIKGSGSDQAAVNVSNSSGEGGGLFGNVNRWRQQLGLAQLSEAEASQLATPLDVQGGKAMVVDLTGANPATGQKTRLIGAILRQPDRTWFYKLMGSEQLVDREKAAFTQFVKTAQYAALK